MDKSSLGKTKQIYLAPMEGITDAIFRNTFEKHFPGIVDKYYTPFISPNGTFKFTTKEWRNIDPALNNIRNTVPQLLTGNAEHFKWALDQILPLGYTEINLNFGCPSGTVVAKKKGSGFLFYPDELDAFLENAFKLIPDNIKLSVKTRLGKNSPEEFYRIFDIYKKYDISELTIHPRIQRDFYREPVRTEFFDYAYEHRDNLTLVYNGEIKTAADASDCFTKYPETDAVMIGRGLLANPFMFDEAFDVRKFKAFHNDLYAQYQELLSGDMPLINRMKELWFHWGNSFPDKEKTLKKIRKANRLAEYLSAMDEI